MSNHKMFPWIALDIKTYDELDEFILKNNSIKTNPDDSGFDKTLAIVQAHHNCAELVRMMYAYLMETNQIHNFMNYIKGNPYQILKYE